MALITTSGRFGIVTSVDITDNQPVAITISKPASFIALREKTGTKNIFFKFDTSDSDEFPVFAREVFSSNIQKSPRGGASPASYTLGYVRSDEGACTVTVIVGYE